MRGLLGLGALLVLVAPAAAACSSTTGPPHGITVVIETQEEVLRTIDTGMSHYPNGCYGAFRLPLLFDGRFAAWRDYGAAVVSVADAATGNVTEYGAADRWSMGQGLLLDLHAGGLRVRELASGNSSIVDPPPGHAWHMVHGTLAMAAVPDRQGLEPSHGFGLFDAQRGTWIVEGLAPAYAGWPGPVTAWLGFDARWIVFEADGALHSHHVPTNTTNGPLPEPDLGSTPAPSPRRLRMLDLRDDVAFILEDMSVFATGYRERAWSVNLSAHRIEGAGRPAPEFVDGARAWFRLDLTSTSSPAPPSGSTATQASADQPPGAAANRDSPLPVPAPAVVLIGLAAAIAAALGRRRQ